MNNSVSQKMVIKEQALKWNKDIVSQLLNNLLPALSACLVENESHTGGSCWISRHWMEYKYLIEEIWENQTALRQSDLKCGGSHWLSWINVFRRYFMLSLTFIFSKSLRPREAHLCCQGYLWSCLGALPVGFLSFCHTVPGFHMQLLWITSLTTSLSNPSSITIPC